MDTYKIYLHTKNKDGTILKSDSFIRNGINIDAAVTDAKIYARTYWNTKSKIFVGSVYIKNFENKFVKI